MTEQPAEENQVPEVIQDTWDGLVEMWAVNPMFVVLGVVVALVGLGTINGQHAKTRMGAFLGCLFLAILVWWGFCLVMIATDAPNFPYRAAYAVMVATTICYLAACGAHVFDLRDKQRKATGSQALTMGETTTAALPVGATDDLIEQVAAIQETRPAEPVTARPPNPPEETRIPDPEPVAVVERPVVDIHDLVEPDGPITREVVIGGRQSEIRYDSAADVPRRKPGRRLNVGR